MTKVFVSYSSQDWEFAELLHNAFRNLKIEVWMDRHSLFPGEQWGKAIHHALRESTHLVLVHTRNSFESDQVWSEWSAFLNRKKPVIPLIVENVELPYSLETFQFVDFLTQPFEEAFNVLAKAILEDNPIPPGRRISPEVLPIRTHKLQISKQPLNSSEIDDNYKIPKDEYSDILEFVDKSNLYSLDVPIWIDYVLTGWALDTDYTSNHNSVLSTSEKQNMNLALSDDSKPDENTFKIEGESNSDRDKVIDTAEIIIRQAFEKDEFWDFGKDLHINHPNFDHIIGGDGNDIVCGSKGSDTLPVLELEGNEAVSGNSDNDIICGGKDSDNMCESQGNDVIKSLSE